MGIVVDKILIPHILSEEQFLLNFADMKEFKLTYSRTKKKNNYYIGYMPDFDKDIDAIYLFSLVKMFYGKTLFYFIEKEEDKFYIFGGHTFKFDNTSFFYKELTVDEIDEIKEIDTINKRLFNTDKSITFFVNTDKDTENYILDLLSSKEGNEKKLFFFVFRTNNPFVKYRAFLLSTAVIAATGFFYYHHYNEVKQKVIEEQESIINNYQTKIRTVKKQIAKIKKNISHYYISDKVKIYIPPKKGK